MKQGLLVLVPKFDRLPERRLPWPAWAWRVPVYAIGSMAAFWTIERIAGF